MNMANMTAQDFLTDFSTINVTQLINSLTTNEEGTLYGLPKFHTKDGEFKGVRIPTAIGGPNCYIDTAQKVEVAFWKMTRKEQSLPKHFVTELNDYWEDVWHCLDKPIE